MQKAAAHRRAMIIAGEASGDLHGSSLVRAIRERDPRIDFWGIGGPRMAAAGVRICYPSKKLAVVGITEVLSRLSDISKGLAVAKGLLRRLRPALLILLDFPDFNLILAAFAKKLGIPVLYYISPQIWAWRRGRARKISRLVDHMAVILPFEKDFYQGYKVPVTFVGHPLLDQEPIPVRDLDHDAAVGDSKVIGLLPGSRTKEIERHLPIMLAAARKIASKAGRIKFLVSVAPALDPNLLAGIIAHGYKDLDVDLVPGGAHSVYSRCCFAIAVSGTVTLEIALSGTPMVIIYRVSRLSYQLGKVLVKVKYMGLMNLIAGREIVPELVQDEVNPDKIADTVWQILGDALRLDQIKSDLSSTRDAMGGAGASRRVAKIALRLMAPAGEHAQK